MGTNDQKLLSERVTLRLALMAGGAAIVGFLLLLLSSHQMWWAEHATTQLLLQQTGGLLFVTAAITLIWETLGKRAFLEEILAKAQVSRDIQFSGLLKVTDSFHTDIDWRHHIGKSSKIDIFFAYGQTWRNSHDKELRSAALRRDTRIRVVLPDPEDEQTVDELAKRFSYEPGKLKARVKDAAQYFQNLREENEGDENGVHIWFLHAAPTFSFYRFDSTGILALYTHRKGRTAVPTFVCEQGGTLYDYVRHEFDAMIDPKAGLATKLV